MLQSKSLLPALLLISDKFYLSSPVTFDNSKRSVLYVCLWCRAQRTSPPQDKLSPGRWPPLPFSCSITMAALCALGWRARWSCYTMTSTTIPHWRAHILPPLPIQEPSLFIALFAFQHMTFALGLGKVRCSNMTWKPQVAHTLRELRSLISSGIYIQYVRSPSIDSCTGVVAYYWGLRETKTNYLNWYFCWTVQKSKFWVSCLEDIANYISRTLLQVWQGTRMQASRGGCGGLELKNVRCGKERSRHKAPRLLRTLIMFGVREDGREWGSPLTACLHVCCCTDVFTVSPRVRESWKTNEMLLFLSLALSRVSLALQRRAAGEVGSRGWQVGYLLCLSYLPFSSAVSPSLLQPFFCSHLFTQLPARNRCLMGHISSATAGKQRPVIRLYWKRSQ